MFDGGPLAIVKRTKITCARDIKRFERELELLCAVAHECVIQPVGVVHAAPTYALVLPLFSRGSLFRLLHNSATELPTRCRVSLALDAFAAVAHLHAAGVIHRDIKPDNLLIADDGRAVLTDFNAAELSANVTGQITVQVGRPWCCIGSTFGLCPSQLRGAEELQHLLTESCASEAGGRVGGQVGWRTGDAGGSFKRA
jgi:serine/threonine-protein kinase